MSDIPNTYAIRIAELEAEVVRWQKGHEVLNAALDSSAQTEKSLRERLDAKTKTLAVIRDRLVRNWEDGGLLHGEPEHRDNLLTRLYEIFNGKGVE